MPSPTPDPSPIDPDREPDPEPQQSPITGDDPASIEGKGLPEIPISDDVNKDLEAGTFLNALTRALDGEQEAERAKGWGRFDQAKAPPVHPELMRRYWADEVTVEEAWVVSQLAERYEVWYRAYKVGEAEMLAADRLASSANAPGEMGDEPASDRDGDPRLDSGDPTAAVSTSHDWLFNHLLPDYDSPGRIVTDPRTAPEIDYDLVRRCHWFELNPTGLGDLAWGPLSLEDVDRVIGLIDLYPAWELASIAADAETYCRRETTDPVDFLSIRRFVRNELHDVEEVWVRRTSEKSLAWRIAILAARTELDALGR